MLNLNPDRIQKPSPNSPDRKAEPTDNPTKPDIEKPSTPNELLRRLRNVDPDKAKKYRQRSGQ
jgi:hypothetical protein